MPDRPADRVTEAAPARCKHGYAVGDDPSVEACIARDHPPDPPVAVPGPASALTCHCGRVVAPRDPDPWEGRMDDFCTSCAANRCDCYPDECPVKYPAPGPASVSPAEPDRSDDALIDAVRRSRDDGATPSEIHELVDETLWKWANERYPIGEVDA